MKNIPENLKYAATHEWAALEQDNLVRVGITDFAQSELGDIVFIGLPDVGRTVSANEQLAVVESVKTARSRAPWWLSMKRCGTSLKKSMRMRLRLGCSRSRQTMPPNWIN